MKKTLTILSVVLVTLISFNAKAQDDKPQIKSYISLLGGMSYPGGDYVKADYNNNKAGYAKNGATFALDGAYYFFKNLGIGATVSFQDQGELTSADAQNLSNGYSTSFEKDITNVTATGRYHSGFAMAGPQYSFIFNKFIVDLRASAGIVKSFSTPIISVIFDNSSTTSLQPTQLSSTARAFAYGGSAGLRFNFADAWDVGVKFNYVNSDGVAINNIGDPGTTGRYVTKEPISVIQATIGITVHL